MGTGRAFPTRGTSGTIRPRGRESRAGRPLRLHPPLLAVALVALAVGVPFAPALASSGTASVTGGFEPPTTPERVVFAHRDCVDERLGVFGPAPHGTHRAAPFLPSPAGVDVRIVVDGGASGSCRPVTGLHAEARNGYAGHVTVTLFDVGAAMGQGPVPDGRVERWTCTYEGWPAAGLADRLCYGPSYYYYERYHAVQVEIRPGYRGPGGARLQSLGQVETFVQQPEPIDAGPAP